MHPFVPAKPLGEERGMLYVTWHYDMNRLHMLDAFPDIHYYAGVGNNTVLGFGYRPFLQIPHATAIKYWKEDGDEYSYAFFHLNQISGVNTNPYIELGGGRSYLNEDWEQSLEVGFGLGNGSGGSVWSWWHGWTWGGNVRFIPLARYVGQGRDLAVSAQYYHGLTDAHLQNVIAVIASDTLMGPTIYADQVDSIVNLEAEKAAYSESAGWLLCAVIMNDGSTYEFFKNLPPPCGLSTINSPYFLLMVPPPDIQMPVRDEWSGTSWVVRKKAQGTGEVSAAEGWTVTNPTDSIVAALERGENVSLNTIGRERLTVVRQWQNEKASFWNDLSVGIGFVDDTRD